jgi:hypothetical protein
MAAVFAIVFQALSFFNGAAPSHGPSQSVTCAPDLSIYGSYGD